MLLVHALSLLCLLASLTTTWLLPSAYLGRLSPGAATVDLPSESALAVSAHAAAPDAAQLAWAHGAWADALCGAAPAAAPPLQWLVRALRAEGLEAEVVQPGSRAVHAVLRAGAGAAGRAALALVTALPADAAALTARALPEACAPQQQPRRPPPTLHGAVVLLALARALAAAPWRAADIALVFYDDAGGGGGGGGNASAAALDGGSGPLGQLLPSALLPSAHASPALAQWARLAQGWDVPWLPHGGGGPAARALAAAWQRGHLLRWAALLLERVAGVEEEGGGEGSSSGYPPPATPPPSLLRPLRHPLPPIRAALVLIHPASQRPPPRHWAVLTQGANGRQADLDLFATLSTLVRPPLSAHAAQRPPASALLPEPQAALAAAALALLWGPTGPHGELLDAGIPAVTLQPAQEGDWEPQQQPQQQQQQQPSAALAQWLARAVRALNGLDEALHAGSRSYMLLPLWAPPQRFLPLPEYVIPLALLHVPVLLLLLGGGAHAPPPSARALAAGALTLLLCTLPSLLAYAVLQHPARLQALASALPALSRACQGLQAARSGAYSAWALAFGLAQVVVGGVGLLVRAWIGRGQGWAGAAAGAVAEGAAAGDAAAAQRKPCMPAHAPPPPSQPSPIIALCLLVLGCTFLPLVYFNAPLLWVGNTAAMWVLVGAAALGVGVAPRARAPARPRARAAALAALWLLTSPLAGLALAAWGGGACAVGERLARASSLHATFGALHVPLALGLWAPMHTALAFHWG